MNRGLIHTDLKFWSLLYLCFPLLLFAWGWLEPGWALLFTGSCLYGAFLMLKGGKRIVIKRKDWLIIALGSAVFALLLGMGGFVPQQDDYLKHNQLWQDLARFSWPVGYQYQGHTYALCYYLAYYLPAAFFAQWIGVGSWPFLSYLWGTAGLMLIFGWGIYVTKQKPLLVLLALMLFGGQDLIWCLLAQLRHFVIEGYWAEWYWDEMGLPYKRALGHKLPTHFGALAWAPQHTVPAAIAAGWSWQALEEKNAFKTLPFLQAVLLLWSPFVAIGLSFFTLYGLWKERLRWIRKIYVFVPALVVGLFLALFFLAHEPMGVRGWIWQEAEDPLWLIYLAFFAMMKFVPLWLLLFFSYRAEKKGRFQRSMLRLIVFGLLGLMPYFMGQANDFYMRGTAPAWFLLSFVLIQRLPEVRGRKWFFYPLLLLFVGGALVPMKKIALHTATLWGYEKGFANTTADPAKNFIQIKEVYMQRGLIGQDKLWDQYVGSPSSFFFEQLAKPIHIQEDKEIRQP